MTLDVLWGQGASTQVRNAFLSVKPTALITESDNPDGTTTLTVVNAGTTLLIVECHKDWVQVVYLQTVCSATLAQREADLSTSKAINAKIVPILQSFGIKALRAHPLDQGTTDAIRNTGGYQPDARGELEWDF